MGTPAFADVSIDDSVSPVHTDGGSIQFSNGAGAIDFQDGGTISGLTASALVSGGTNAVTTGQLWQTNEDLTTVTATVTGLNTSVGTLTTNVSTLTTNVGTLNSTVGTHTTQISNLQTAANASVRYDDAATKSLITLQGAGAGTRITNLADGNIASGSKDAVTGGQMYVLEQKLYSQGQGIKYFHANSTLADSIADGSDSIAIGPEAESAGAGSFAAGHGAATMAGAEAGVALGQGAQVGTDAGVDGVASIAIGRNSAARGDSNIALGDGAAVDSKDVQNALALGSGATVTGDFSSGALAVGNAASAGAANATAVGSGAQATGASASAFGHDAAATAGSAVAIGDGAQAATANSIALGTGAGVGTVGNSGGDRTSHIAIGTNAGQNVVGNQTMAIGFGAGSNMDGDYNLALGALAGAGLDGDENVAVGYKANYGNGTVVAREHSTAIGSNTNAGTNAVAIGYGADGVSEGSVAIGVEAQSTTGWGVAIGRNAVTVGDSVALGARSEAYQPAPTELGYITGSAAPNNVVSVGNAAQNLQRRITNVADGSQGYDAVNVRQLSAAQSDMANVIGGGVKVENGKLVGPDAGLGPIKIGDDYYASINDALSSITSPGSTITPVDPSFVRYDTGTGNGKITLQGGAAGTVLANVADGGDPMDAVNVRQLNNAVADGKSKYFSVKSSLPGNRDNTGASGNNAIAIGPESGAVGDASLALGLQASAKDINAIAIGTLTEAIGANSSVLGNNSLAYDSGGVAIGQQAVSRGENSIVIGTGAQADPKTPLDTVDNAVVIGTGAEATANDGMAMGRSAMASNLRSVAQGYDAESSGVDATALGSGSRATATNAYASGTDARASGEGAIASGTSARGYAANAIAMGSGAVSGIANPSPEDLLNNVDTIAIGTRSQALAKNSVALGVDSTTRNAYASTTSAYSNVAHDDAKSGVVSVGSHDSSSSNATNGTIERRITNVAGGQDDTDAVNVLQLKAVDTLLTERGTNYSGNEGGQVHRDLGQVLAIRGGTTSTAGTFSGANIKTVTDPASGAINIQMADSPKFGDVVVNAGNTGKISGVAAGAVNAASTEAVNGSQLYNLAGNVTNIFGGNAVNNNGVITFTNIGDTGENTIHDAIKSVNTAANAGWNLTANGTGSTRANIGPNGDVAFNGDSNITVTQSGVDDDGIINVALNKDIDLGPAGSVKTGNSLLNDSGLNVANGALVTQIGAGGITVGGGVNTIVINAGSGDITGLTNKDLDAADFATKGRAATEEQLKLVQDQTGDLTDRAVKYDLNPDNTINHNLVTMEGTPGGATKDAAGRIETTGGTQITNVASAGDYTNVNNALNAVNAGDLNNAVQDVTQAGLDFSANAGADVHRNLGQTLAIRGGMADTTPTSATSGENVITRTTADGISIELAKDATFDSITTGDTVMDTDGVRVGANVALTNTGLRAGTIVISSATNDIIGLSNTTLTAPGFATAGRAATEEQLQLVRGETKDLADRAVKYDLNPDNTVNYGKVTMEGDVSTDGGRTGGTGITNVARGDISANSTDAVNGSQIHDMGNSIAEGMGGGSKFVDGKLVTELNVGGDTYNNVNDALNGVQNNVDNVTAIANKGWNVQANGDTASKVGPGDTVQFINGDNVEITRDNANITVSMAKDIKVDTVTSNKVTTKELAIENGPTINQGGIDMGGKQITNLADGKADSDAVNVGQLNKVAGNVANSINRLDGRVSRVDNRASAGVAAAIATAGLPQAYLPGKSMFSVAGGTWRGESGYAMGLSTVSDNGKWIVKGSFAGSSRGDYGGAVGVGYQW